MRALHGRLSGLCQPTYVLDIPGGYGKSPIGPSYLPHVAAPRRALRHTGSRTSTGAGMPTRRARCRSLNVDHSALPLRHRTRHVLAAADAERMQPSTRTVVRSCSTRLPSKVWPRSVS